MMKIIQLINTLKGGMVPEVDINALVETCEKKYTKNGDMYLNVKLVDNTGEILFRKWMANDIDLVLLAPGKVINLKDVEVNYYNGTYSLQTRMSENITPALGENPDNYKLSVIPNEVDLKEKLHTILSTLVNPNLKAMCKDIMEAEWFTRFYDAPAAKANHHAEKYGLLYHTERMLESADKLCQVYYDVDRDVVLTSVFLHDIGKLKEMTPTAAGNGEYTKYALLGHIYMGAKLVGEYVTKGILSEEEGLKIQHCILSHHGKLEYGSPILPQIKEALLVHYVDELDAQINSFENALMRLEDGEYDGKHYKG